MKKIDNSIKITGMIIAAVIVLALIFIISANISFEDKKTINSQGEAVISVMPDIVVINFAVETTGNTSKEAKDENAEIVTDAVDSLMGLGFERKDIETLNFNIYEEFDWTEDGRESLGFKATHNIRVKFDAESQPELGPIVDAGVDAGALLRYINFELSPELESKYKAQALELAGNDARLKANAIVSGVGGQLGKLVSVSETNFEYQPWRAYGGDDMMEAGVAVNDFKESTSIQIGEREITGRISVVYEIR